MRTPLKRVYIDVETTGLDKEIHAIHQISGQIEIDNVVVESFDYKVKPFEGAVIDEASLKLCEEHALTVEDLMQYPNQTAVYNDLKRRFKKHSKLYEKNDKFTFVGYNANFDKGFVTKFWERNNDDYFFAIFWGSSIDVLSMAMQYLEEFRDELENFELVTVCKYVGIEVDETKLHNAEYDIYLTRELFQFFKNLDSVNNKKIIKEIVYVEKEVEKEIPQVTQSTTNSVDELYENFMKQTIAEPIKATTSTTNNNSTTNTSQKQPKSLNKIDDLNFEINFGKHSGRTIGEILNIDSQYIIWLHDNIVKGLQFSNEIMTKAIQNKSDKKSHNTGYNNKPNNSYKPSYSKPEDHNNSYEFNDFTIDDDLPF